MAATVLTWWFCVGWLQGWWLLWRLTAPPPGAAIDVGVQLDDVSVVVPARNEAGTVGALVRDLLGSSSSPGLVIVVDDQSTDDTASIAETAGAVVVPSDGPPPGWTGKAWACWIGAERADGRILVFLDADVRLAPSAVDRLVAEHDRGGGGLLSVQPYHFTTRPYEQLSLYFNLVGLMAAGEFTPRRVDARAAFGPCLVCRRDEYLAVGGHSAVRGDVVEDLAMARRFRRAGLPVRALAGRDLVRFRMYPGGPAQLLEGWTKNMAAGAGATGVIRLAAVVLWIGSGVAAAGLGIAALVGHRPALGAASYGLAAGQLAWMARRAGRFSWWSVALFPGPLAFFAAVFTRSVVITRTKGRVSWRGRSVDVGRRARQE